MKARALKYYGKLEVVESPAQHVRHGHILVKVMYVFISEVEKILFSGWEPVVKPITPGSSGVVRVLEDPSGKHSEMSGRACTVSPLGVNGVLGLDTDGLLSTYQSLHPSYIYSTVQDPKPLHSIQPYVAYSATLGEKTYGSTLIVGCEFSETATAMYISSYKGEEPVLICSNPLRPVRALGFKVYKHVGDLDKRYDTVVIGHESFSLIHSVLSEVSAENIVVSAFSRLKAIPVTSKLSARVRYVSRVELEEGYSAVEEISKKLMHFLRVLSISSPEEVTGIMPPRGLGIILELKD